MKVSQVLPLQLLRQKQGIVDAKTTSLGCRGVEVREFWVVNAISEALFQKEPLVCC